MKTFLSHWRRDSGGVVSLDSQPAAPTVEPDGPQATSLLDTPITGNSRTNAGSDWPTCRYELLIIYFQTFSPGRLINQVSFGNYIFFSIFTLRDFHFPTRCWSKWTWSLLLNTVPLLFSAWTEDKPQRDWHVCLSCNDWHLPTGLWWIR